MVVQVIHRRFGNVTDPNATTLGAGTAQLVTSNFKMDLCSAGSGYKQENTAGAVSGDGFALIF